MLPAESEKDAPTDAQMDGPMDTQTHFLNGGYNIIPRV